MGYEIPEEVNGRDGIYIVLVVWTGLCTVCYRCTVSVFQESVPLDEDSGYEGVPPSFFFISAFEVVPVCDNICIS